MIGENGGGDKEGVVMETVRVKETLAVVVMVKEREESGFPPYKEKGG